MTLTQTSLSVLMLVAGIGIPFMAAMNAGLGEQAKSPMLAVFVLCVVALCVSAVFLAISPPPSINILGTASPVYFFGGALFVLYIASITISAPVIGLGNAVFYVLLGQLLSAALIDHFGLLGAPMVSITPKRTLGLIIMAVGVYLARKDISPLANSIQ